jgi:hypothetical protein
MNSVKSTAARLIVNSKPITPVVQNSEKKVGIVKTAANLLREKVNGCCK